MNEMRSLILSYLLSIMHPFNFASYTSGGRFMAKSIKEDWSRWGVRPLAIAEAVALAWIFEIIASISILALFSFKDYFLLIHPMLKMNVPSSFFVITIGLWLVIFPFRLIFTVYVWKWFLSFFMKLYVDDDEIEEHLDGILSHSLSSHIITVIPFFGKALQGFLWGFYLFVGMKNIYQLSSLQCLLIFILIFLSNIILFFSCLLGLIMLFVYGFLS